MNEFVIAGTIMAILPEESGTSRNGHPWRKQVAVLNTGGQFPRDIAFQMFNDIIKPLVIGEQVVVKVNIQSREYNGRWYTDINAYSISQLVQQQPTIQSQSYPPQPQYNCNPQGQAMVPQQGVVPPQGMAPQQGDQQQAIGGMPPADDLPF